MVTLNDESINNRRKAPIAKGANESNTGQFGMSINAIVETIAPPKMNGILRPNLVQILSENIPTIG